jgi:hypothetical protein
LATSKLVKPHTPHPTPHTLPPPKNFLPQTLIGHNEGIKQSLNLGKTDIILMKGYGYQHPENLGDRS